MSPGQIALCLIFVIAIFAGMICHGLALRHIRAEGAHLMHKDSLMRTKHLAFDEKGARLVRWQKNLYIVAGISGAALALTYSA